jgi:hypothetical protein
MESPQSVSTVLSHLSVCVNITVFVEAPSEEEESAKEEIESALSHSLSLIFGRLSRVTVSVHHTPTTETQSFAYGRCSAVLRLWRKMEDQPLRSFRTSSTFHVAEMADASLPSLQSDAVGLAYTLLGVAEGGAARARAVVGTERLNKAKRLSYALQITTTTANGMEVRYLSPNFDHFL